MTQDIDLEALDALAEQATPGPWTADPGPDYDPTDWVIFAPTGQWLANVHEPLPSDQRSPIADALEANARYLAALDPDTVRTLIRWARMGQAAERTEPR